MKEILRDRQKLLLDRQFNDDVLRPQNTRKPIDLSMENKVTKTIKRGRNVVRDTIYLPPHMWYFIKTKAEELNVPNGFIVECIFNECEETIQSWDKTDWKLMLGDL